MAAKAVTVGAAIAVVRYFLRSWLSRRWIGLSMVAVLAVGAASVVKVEERGNRELSAILRLVP